MAEWRSNLLETADEIRLLLDGIRRIAVLGMKPESRAEQPAHFVPEYLIRAGFDVVPIPVYYPEIDVILQRPVFRRLADVPGPIDLVNVFRKPKDLPPHVPDLLAAAPGAVWLQSGIRHDNVARTLAEAGIRVVQDRCLMVEHRRLL